MIIRCSNCQTKNRVDPGNASVQTAKCGKCGTPLDVNQPEEKEVKPRVVTDATFEREVLRASHPFLLDCWAAWCGPCRMIAPIMDQLAAEANGRYEVGKLDVDDNPQTAAQFQIRSIPTMLIFKDGTLVDRLVGAQPKHAIAERLQTHVN